MIKNNENFLLFFLDVLIYNVELDTDETYRDGHADPNSLEFGTLAGPIEDYVSSCWFYKYCLLYI
jgi:hypothetical protein